MALKTAITAISSYHNYKFGGILKKEITFGTEGDGFYFHAAESVYPEPFPKISCNLFDEKGRLVVSILRNETGALGEGCREDRDPDALAFYNREGRKIISFSVRRYQNVYVTELEGEFFDENGKPVMI